MRQGNDSKILGHVVGMWRYPVKSMGAEPLASVDVSWFGLAGDRRWAFVRHHTETNGFPWLTIRECGDMHDYQPVFKDPSQPDKSPVIVKTPAGDVFDINDPALGKILNPPEGARLIKQNRGVFDAFPISLVTTQSITKLEETVGSTLHVQRFRPNLLVELNDGEPYSENHWIGHNLRIGGLRIRADKRDGRCVVIMVDPESNERNPKVLRAVQTENQGSFGVYGSIVDPGTVAIGDPVLLEPAQ